MSWKDRIKSWQNKTEGEKHFISIVGASFITGLVVVSWGYGMVSKMGTSQPVAEAQKTINEQFSPLAAISQTFSDNWTMVKAGFKVAGSQLSAVVSGLPEATTTEIIKNE